MSRRRRGLEVELEVLLGQPELVTVGAVFVVLIGLEGTVVGVVARAQFHIVAGVHHMPPPQGRIQVGIGERRVCGEREAVVGPVTERLQGIALVELMGDGGVHVLERRFAPVVMAVLGQQAQDPVGISGAATQQEGGLVLHQGAFQVQPAGEQAQSQGTADFLAVSLAGTDIQHRGNAAAVLGGNGALVQLCLLHQFGVEGGKDTE